MKHYQCITQKTPVDMGIYFSCHYRFVPKHFLDSPQVGSGFYHMCCKGVSERMRTDLFHNACLTSQIPDYCEYHRSGEFSAPPVQKNDIPVIYYRQPAPVDLVKINLLQRFNTYRYQPLLISFPCNANKSLTIMNICKPQVNKLRNP